MVPLFGRFLGSRPPDPKIWTPQNLDPPDFYGGPRLTHPIHHIQIYPKNTHFLHIPLKCMFLQKALLTPIKYWWYLSKIPLFSPFYHRLFTCFFPKCHFLTTSKIADLSFNSSIHRTKHRFVSARVLLHYVFTSWNRGSSLPPIPPADGVGVCLRRGSGGGVVALGLHTGWYALNTHHHMITLPPHHHHPMIYPPTHYCTHSISSNLNNTGIDARIHMLQYAPATYHHHMITTTWSHPHHHMITNSFMITWSHDHMMIITKHAQMRFCTFCKTWNTVNAQCVIPYRESM